MSAPRKVSVQPISRLLVEDAPVISDARYLQDDDAVVIVKDIGRHEAGNDLAGFERCFDDPDRLQGPAIINRTRKRLIE